MGSSRAGTGGGTTLRDIGQRGSAVDDAQDGGPGATATERAGRASRHQQRLSTTNRKARRRRRVRRLLVTSAIIGAGFVAGLIGGMVSGVA